QAWHAMVSTFLTTRAAAAYAHERVARGGDHQAGFGGQVAIPTRSESAAAHAWITRRVANDFD
ncbi:MAG: hypothetical protein OEM97_00530, partial [Acidimicrobiia bacterium]|nr:hypothetical protein [Acidimicrobiia bacterium]